MSAGLDLRGRILDADSHELTPASMWAETFGEITSPLAAYFLREHEVNGINSFNADVGPGGTPVTEETLAAGWQGGALAPGAFDMERRLEVLDLMGVDRQLVFATGPGIIGLALMSASSQTLAQLFGLEVPQELIVPMGRELLKAYNEWCVRVSAVSPRLRPVAFIDTNDIATAIADAEALIDSGIRAIGIQSDLPPGQMSPGHPAVDPLWRVFAESNVPVLLHISGNLGLFRSQAWSQYGGASNVIGKCGNPELALDPYSISQLGMAAQTFLTAMIFGGAFERNPGLRLGSIENSAYWVGPMAENMEGVGRQMRRLTSHLSLLPSEYLQRNVRATPFWWEPVDKFIDRHGLEDVYIYGSDYPHFEGGHNPQQAIESNLARLGPDVAEKFFVKNAQLLMP